VEFATNREFDKNKIPSKLKFDVLNLEDPQPSTLRLAYIVRDMVGVTEKLAWIVAYAACSSSMLVVNKLAVEAIPLPTIVSASQLVVSAAFVLIIQTCGIRVMEPIEKSKILPFVVYTVLFAASIFSNMKALLLVNIGAVIAARSCLPIVVCLIEWVFMERKLPGPRSALSLSGVVFFAFLYIRLSTSVAVGSVRGCAWLFSWWMFLAICTTYGKWMTEEIIMTQWERVFYTNAFAIPPTVIIFLTSGELGQISEVNLRNDALCWLILSCLMGVLLSYSGWKARSITTATTFTLVGVLNKMATIAYTAMLWPENISIKSFTALVGCILSGMLYQDAPKRTLPAKM